MTFVTFFNSGEINAKQLALEVSKLYLNTSKLDEPFPCEGKVLSRIALRENLNEYVGFYSSREIRAFYDLKVKNGHLFLFFKSLGSDVLFKVKQDETFEVSGFYFVTTGKFTRDSEKKVNGFIMNTDKFVGIKFLKTNKKPDFC